jgi:hypothetical protein
VLEETLKLALLRTRGSHGYRFFDTLSPIATHALTQQCSYVTVGIKFGVNHTCHKLSSFRYVGNAYSSFVFIVSTGKHFVGR